MLNSGDADGLRASKQSHGVEHSPADRHFCHLRTDMACPQAVAREHLELTRQVLDQRVPVIATAFPPLRAAALCNGGDGIVPPASARRNRGPWRRSVTHRARRLGAARADRRMAVLRVVRPDDYRAALKAITVSGVTAEINFDDHGALKSASSTLYQVQQGKWVPVVAWTGRVGRTRLVRSRSEMPRIR